MIVIDMRSRTPIYEQLVDCIAKQVLAGEMKADEPVPSVRALSAELSVNPNTVQKAFTELERRGILYSVPGKGRFVSGEIGPLCEKEKKEMKEALYALICSAEAIGIPAEEIAALAKEAEKKMGGKNDD